MQDNLHEMSKPIFWKKLEKYYQGIVCRIHPEGCLVIEKYEK